MQNAQIYTIIALCIYAAAMALIGCISYGKSKTLDGFLIGGRKIGAWSTAFSYGTTYFSAVVFIRNGNILCDSAGCKLFWQKQGYGQS